MKTETKGGIIRREREIWREKKMLEKLRQKRCESGKRSRMELRMNRDGEGWRFFCMTGALWRYFYRNDGTAKIVHGFNHDTCVAWLLFKSSSEVHGRYLSFFSLTPLLDPSFSQRDSLTTPLPPLHFLFWSDRVAFEIFVPLGWSNEASFSS